jgi:hypothetical protein
MLLLLYHHNQDQQQQPKTIYNDQYGHMDDDHEKKGVRVVVEKIISRNKNEN